MDLPQADVQENFIQQLSPELLEVLLIDHTTSTPENRKNIFWGTRDYEHLGLGYGYFDAIQPDKITGINGLVIQPRVVKSASAQQSRSRDMAEVFTPAWVCNAQNNLVDQAWFGKTDVFNKEVILPDGSRTWRTKSEKIVFSGGKTWLDYVRACRLEVTCGEAPYLVSRYDTTSGLPIPLKERIGLLDRKLRVVSENTHSSREWLKAAQEAYKSIYAYEWQGDNLLIARESLLISFIEYYQEKFGKFPLLKSIRYIAYIISWNVWQMDGIKCVIPDSCGTRTKEEHTLFDTIQITTECEGCVKNSVLHHNGIYCCIKDWKVRDKQTGKKGRKIPFVQFVSPNFQLP